jgi:hypothetical protein
MARLAANRGEPNVRVGFELYVSDNPLLVAELLKLPKGKLRHARLVTLATIGLLMERSVISGAAPRVPVVADPATDNRGDDARPISPLSHQEFTDIDWDHADASEAGPT